MLTFALLITAFYFLIIGDKNRTEYKYEQKKAEYSASKVTKPDIYVLQIFWGIVLLILSTCHIYEIL